MHIIKAVAPPSAAPLRQRSVGTIRLSVCPVGEGRASRIRGLAESGPSRLRFPRHAAGPLEAVLVNTAGGIACGDSFTVDLTLDPGSTLVFTTTAAEKIYRSDGPESRIDNRVVLGEGARLDWLPQETILFDRGRLRRRFEADLAPGAGLIAVETVAFGRAARGERLVEGLFADAWRVRRAGRLTYADTLLLEGPLSDLLARAAIGGGAGAAATLLDVSPGAEARLDDVRSHLEQADLPQAGIDAAASAWNGHLAVRMLARAVGPLREHLGRFLAHYRGESMPRVWQS